MLNAMDKALMSVGVAPGGAYTPEQMAKYKQAKLMEDLVALLRQAAETDVSLRDRLRNYDSAAEKAYAVGALRQLKSAEASLGRWLVEHIYPPKEKEND